MDKPNIRPITPEIVQNYLEFKKFQEHKNFLSYRDDHLSHFFSQEEFCHMINSLRKKMWEYREEKKTSDEKIKQNEWQKKDEWDKKKSPNKEQECYFDRAVKEIIVPKIKNIPIDFSIIKKLVGVLLHVFKDSNYQEYLNQAKAKIYNNLSTNTKEDEFYTIFQSLKESYFFDQEIGNETSGSENERFFEQAWQKFETEEMKNISPVEKSKLYKYLFQKYVR